MYPTASEEPENNEHFHVRCQGTRNGEDQVAQVASMVDIQTAVKLTERCDQDWTKSKTKKVAVRRQHELSAN